MPIQPENWGMVKALFEAALDQDSAHRSSFLNERCPDTSLRGEVERLLAEHAQAGEFLSTPAMGRFSFEPGTQSQPERLSEGDLLAGRFRIVRFIARGGMGEVYEGEDLELRERVAVKTIRPEILAQPNAVARFKREVHLARQVTHPNVCRIFDIFRHKFNDRSEEIVFISMELLHGKTLAERLEENGRLSTEEALPLVKQMAAALSAAHDVGVIHQDLKPGNVLLIGSKSDTRGVRAVITDFGLASRSIPINGQSSSTTQSINPNVYGTPQYLAPEQIGGQPTTIRTDIYALGLVIYEMVTGDRPFQAGTPILASIKRLSEPPIPPRKVVPDISAMWESVILRCLEREPACRFANAHEIAAELSRGDQSNFALPVTTKFAPSARNYAYRKVVLFALAVLGVLSVGIFVWSPVGSGRTAFSAGSIRFKRLTNDGKSSAAAISSDGKYVAYVHQDGVTQSLWIRQVATSIDAQILAPRERIYSNLLFSVDGNYLYFADAPRNDAEDFEYNISDPDASLRRVPTFGGTPFEVVSRFGATVVDVDASTTRQFTFSPDGKKLCFVGSSEHLFMVNPDGTQLRRIIPDNWDFSVSDPAWSPNGRMLAVAERWGRPSGATRVFSRNPEVFTPLQISTLSIASLLGAPLSSDTTPAALMKVLSPRRWSNVGRLEWMPNGTGLAFDGSERSSDPSQLWFISYPKGDVSRITNDLNEYRGLGVASDSRTLVTTQRQVVQSTWILPHGDTNRGHPIVSTSGTLYSPMDSISWATDEKLIYATRTNGNEDIWIMDADGNNKKRLTADSNNNWAPFLARDGRSVLFLSDRSGVPEAWSMDADGSNPRRLVQFERSSGFSPSFLPDVSLSSDGKWAVYLGSSEGWKVASVSTHLTQSDPGLSSKVGISPNGKMVLRISAMFWGKGERKGGPTQDPPIEVFDFESARLIKNFDIPPFSVTWAPDSQSLMYVVTHRGVSNIWSQPLAGGPPRQITNFASDHIFSYAWSRDSKQLVVVRGNILSDIVLIN